MVEEFLVPMAWSVVYILEGFVLLWIAKAAYTRIYRRVDLKAALFDRNNHALAVSTSGYLLGVVIALGGVLGGSSGGWQADLASIALSGGEAIVLMLIASFLCEKLLLPHFNNTVEVVDKDNLGTAFVEAGVHVANGLIVLAVNQGTGEHWIGLIFWLLAQAVLIVFGLLYEWMTPHRIHDELHQANTAVGLALGGALVGMGNVISLAVSGDFLGWQDSLVSFLAYAVFGCLVLAIIKKLTDLLLAPGVKLADEQTEGSPNVGAGLLEAFGYVGGSMLIVWVL